MTTRIITGDCRFVLAEMAAESVHCCVTSPPYYGLRDYGIAGQLGLEDSPALYVEQMVGVFREVRRVLRGDGALFLNVGDSYASGGKHPNQSQQSEHVPACGMDVSGSAYQSYTTKAPKPKDLLGIPWMLAFALRDDGWYLRSEITWAKKAPMPESVRDRPTSATEKIFLLAKSPTYYYDSIGLAEELDPSSLTNARNFWLLSPEPFASAHFATFPTEIPRRAILAGTSERGVCPQCAAPWERVVEQIYRGGKRIGDTLEIGRNLNRMGGQKEWDAYEPARTIGWRPTCVCNSDGKYTNPIPATVLDPFGGAGTVGMVADRLGRHSTIIELNPAYAEMSRRRIERDAGMFAVIT